MGQVRILHCADVHFGKQSDGDVWQAFLNICGLCRKEQIQLLLIAGDLFEENRISRKLFEKVMRVLAGLAPTEVLISPGNHDCLSMASVYTGEELPENVTVFTKPWECKRFPQWKTCVWGGAFLSPHETEDLYGLHAEVGKTEEGWTAIGLLHGEVTAAGGSMYRPIPKTWIAQSGLHYLALGHIHAHSPLMREGITYYAYPGCPQGQGFDEEGACGVYLGSVGENGVNLSFRETAVREWHTVSLTAPVLRDRQEQAAYLQERERWFCEKFGKSFQNHHYRILLQGTRGRGEADWQAEDWQEFLKELLPLATVREERTVSENYSRYAQEPGIRGAFVRRLLEQLEKTTAKEEQKRIRKALEAGLKAFEEGDGN